MLEQLIHSDRELFLAIHHVRNGFFDVIMPIFTNRWVWIPLYAFFAWWLFRKFGSKMVVILPVVACMILISDQGANLFKNSVKRARPCHDTELLQTGTIFTPDGCGGPYGFFSGHAANSFAIAIFMFLMTRKSKTEPSRLWLLIFVWSIVVCWSRVYMGVHFPGDVLAGALYGSLIGGAVYYALNKYYLDRNNA